MIPAPSSCGFDLDLTLVDTRNRILVSAVAAFEDLGAPITSSQVEPLLGSPLTVKAAALAPDIDPTSFVDRYRHHYGLAGDAACPAMPGALDALHAVHDAGHRVVVVSAKFYRFVQEALAGAGLADLVDAIHAELFAVDKGPALRAEDAWVYAGDHPGDVTAAHAARAYAVGVATGVHDGAALRDAGADLVLNNLRAFPAFYAERDVLLHEQSPAV